MAACFCYRLVFCFYGYKTINGGVGMAKHIVLSDEELELLITGLHCIDECGYNVYRRTCTSWSEAKEMKETLRVKMIRAQLNV